MPAVQVVDMPSWGSALGKFGNEFLGGYAENVKKTGKEDALQDMLADVQKRKEAGESDEDIMMSIMTAKNVPFQERKSASDIYAQSSKNKATLEAKKLEQAQKQEEFNIKKKQKDRELDIKQEAERNKTKPLTPYEKKRQELSAKEQIDIFKETAKVDSALRDMQHIGALIEETTGTGTFNLQKRNQLALASAAALEPILKIYNPTGQVSGVKLAWINDNFRISNNESRWAQRGKQIEMTKLLSEQKRRLQQRQQLVDEWNGNPPMNVLREFDNESEKIYDDVIGWNEESAKRGIYNEAPSQIQEQLKNAPKDKVINGPEGKKYKWVEDKWVQI